MPPAAATPTLTSAISGAAQVKMAWKRIAITTKKTGRPSPVERNTRSSRSWILSSTSSRGPYARVSCFAMRFLSSIDAGVTHRSSQGGSRSR